MGVATVSQSINGRGVAATITWGSGPTVTVTITGNAGYGAQAYWRVRGKNPDTTVYINTTSASSGSFDAVDGTTYYFQAVWGNTSDGAGFTVNFDSGGSGDSGDDTSGILGYLHVNQGEGTLLHIRRSWPLDRPYGVDLETGEPIYSEDRFYIIVDVLEGYELDYYTINDKQCPYFLDNFIDVNNDGNYIYYAIELDGDASVTSTATPIATAHIYNGSSWDKYAPYIYDKNSGWNRYTPYIYNGSSWDRYS